MFVPVVLDTVLLRYINHHILNFVLTSEYQEGFLLLKFNF